MLQQAIRDCDAAYKNFFDSLQGERAGKRVGAPRFQSRKDIRQAIRLHTGGFSIRGDGKLRLARIGDVKVAWSRDLPSAPSSVTAIKTADGRYFASSVVEVGEETLPPAVDEAGQEHELALDLGLSAFAVDQHGRTITNPRFLRRAERKLKRAQRELARKQRGSNNRAKVRRKLARAHAKVTDTRLDWLQQETTRTARENQAVYLEDLAVSGLARTRLAKSVQDASWGTFRRLLEEKCARWGRELAVIDRWLPTSQTCSECGRIDGRKELSVRTWSCPCGAVHDRDTNAARNILAAGRAERRNACGPDVRPHTGAVGDEAGSSGTPARAHRSARGASRLGIPAVHVESDRVRETDLSSKPDLQTGKPRPPHAPLEPDWKMSEERHKNGESKVPRPPEGEGPTLEWFYPTAGRGGFFIGIALVIFVGFLTLRDGGIGWMANWWLWVIMAPFLIFFWLYNRSTRMSAGADWLCYGKKSFIKTYELVQVNATTGGAARYIELKDHDGNTLSVQLNDLQLNRELWDLVYNGILHSVR